MYTLTTRYQSFASDMIAHTLKNIMFVETKTKQRGHVKTTMHTKFPLEIPLTSEKRRNSEETNNNVTGLTLDSLENGSPTHGRTGAN